jgi:CRISPR-associated helicase Cas3
MIESAKEISIKSRSAPLISDLHPFQIETLKAVNNRNAQIIIVEAPVGAGKSRIVRDIALKPDRKEPIILSYPTKILMETQLSSLKKEALNLSVWPDDSPNPETIPVFNYSTDALIRFMRKQKMTAPPDRSSLWQRVLFTHEGMRGPFFMVTTPDVLWLLFIAEVYRPANRLQNYLQNSIIVFDEFHLFYGLDTFPELIEKMLNTVAKKIILLSATPILSETLRQLQQKFITEVITFKEGQNCNHRIFNYPLKLYVHTFRHTNIDEAEKEIRQVLQELPTPAAIIMDSVFRLAHLKKRLCDNPPSGLRIIEWSGRFKEEHGPLREGDVVLGTSSIEVGIDMVFRGAIVEAWEWSSTIQRLGRIGRHCRGVAHLFTRSRDLNLLIGEKGEWGRTEFEKNVLKNGLNDPRVEKIRGGGFRGRSFSLLMYDKDLSEPILYNEQILCQYDVTDREEYWQEYSLSKKHDYLKRQLRLKDEKTEELLLYDALVPWWGVLQGSLSNKYNRIEYFKFDQLERELIIQTEADSFAFYGTSHG